MGAGETPRTSLERFAADLVGLDQRGKSADTLAGLFRKLRDDDYLPDPVTQEAILALAGRPIRRESMLFQEASEFQERRLNEEVERFAAEFFAIPVNARIERWKGLAETCSRKSRLIERLRDLKPGLTIDAARAVDPSPLVKSLIDDILTLFPMRPSQKAVESRIRVQRFLAETQGKPADRSKVLKQLRKRHPDLAALAEGHLDQFSEVRRPVGLNFARNKPVEEKPRAIRSISQDSGNIRAFVIIAVVLVSAVARFFGNDGSRRPSPGLPSFPISAQPSVTKQAPAPASAPNLIVRDELKRKIREELDKLDKFLGEPQLDRLVAGLPVEVVPNVGGMGTVRLLGAWTENIHARFVKALREGLMDANLGLTDQEIDDVIARCLPSTSPSSAPARPNSP